MSGRHFWQWDQNHQVMIQVFLVFSETMWLLSGDDIWDHAKNCRIILLLPKSLVLLLWWCLFQPSNFSSFLPNNCDYSQCVKGPFLVQKLQILEKLKNGQFLFFCQNWLFFSNKQSEKVEFSRLNWSKIVISWVLSGQF